MDEVFDYINSIKPKHGAFARQQQYAQAKAVIDKTIQGNHCNYETAIKMLSIKLKL